MENDTLKQKENEEGLTDTAAQKAWQEVARRSLKKYHAGVVGNYRRWKDSCLLQPLAANEDDLLDDLLGNDKVDAPHEAANSEKLVKSVLLYHLMYVRYDGNERKEKDGTQYEGQLTDDPNEFFLHLTVYEHLAAALVFVVNE